MALCGWKVLGLIISGLLVTPNVAAGQTPQPKLWYHAERSIDLTGDRVPELITLSAYEGATKDSFTFVLNIIRDDSAVLTRSWRDMYGWFATAQFFTRAQWRQGVREELDSILAPSRFEPTTHYPSGRAQPRGIDCTDPEDPRECIAFAMRFDSLRSRWKREGRSLGGTDSIGKEWFAELAVEPFDTNQVERIWNDIRAHTPVLFLLDFGYESHEVIAWSNLMGRFYLLRQCC